MNTNNPNDEDKATKKDSANGSAFAKIASNVASFVSQTKNKIGSFIDKTEEHAKNKKLFESESIKFTIVPGTPTYAKQSDFVNFSGLKSMQDGSLLVLSGVELRAGDVIVSQEGNFRITDVDRKHEIDFPTDGSSPYPIKCYKCRYEVYIITQVAKQQSDLEAIENAINSYKPNFLQKKKKQEALELYGNFKNCIINKTKDESLFSKFLGILKEVAPTVIAIAQSLISALS